jgi:hypothetical protein
MRLHEGCLIKRQGAVSGASPEISCTSSRYFPFLVVLGGKENA